MRILVISHNIFSESASMGKTLSSYFKDWNVDEIAQFYIHSEIPTVSVCENYFRFTDKDALKSIFSRKGGTIFHKADIRTDKKDSFVFDGHDANLYQKCRKRTPFVYLARNTVWRFSAWNNKKFKKWVDEFSPDAIFLASGDYAFLYRIALKTAKRKKIPLVISCMDDYYLHNKNQHRFLGKFTHKRFMKQVRKTVAYSACLMCICEKMSNAYAELFQKPCYTLHTPTALNAPLHSTPTNSIAYLGNLGYKRYESLVEIGRTLQALNLPQVPRFVDVYTTEPRMEILQHLSEANGIRLHKAVPFEEVKTIMSQSLALIHTESFEEGPRRSVTYSVSTKIADSLASGTCILAYGPADIASIEYLNNHNAAFVATSNEELQTKLIELFTNQEARKAVRSNALRLAQENHDSLHNTKLVADILNSLL